MLHHAIGLKADMLINDKRAERLRLIRIDRHLYKQVYAVIRQDLDITKNLSGKPVHIHPEEGLCPLESNFRYADRLIAVIEHLHSPCRGALRRKNGVKPQRIHRKPQLHIPTLVKRVVLDTSLKCQEYSCYQYQQPPLFFRHQGKTILKAKTYGLVPFLSRKDPILASMESLPLPGPPIIDVIIPAFNEEQAIGAVIRDIPVELVRHILVCDNGSTDATAKIAGRHGAIVVSAPQKGYGAACLAGMEWIGRLDPMDQPDIVVFLDGDHSDYPEEMPRLVSPIVEGRSDLVIGSRALGVRETGAMLPQQIFGNWLATTLIRLIYRYQFTDLGPFRAIRWTILKGLGMKDRDFGWTVEMQVRAAKAGIPCSEVPVSYRKRIGISKVSGTVKGTFLAGYKILWTIFKLL